jgi:hypothetical protein
MHGVKKSSDEMGRSVYFTRLVLVLVYFTTTDPLAGVRLNVTGKFLARCE